ncbi:DUF2235 domain-containing protein [soil metagenome]
MPKNIVICCDGTGNGFDKVLEESNVAKLYSSLEIGPRQFGYYHPGVGTMGDPNARGWASKHWSKIRGLAFGHGLLRNVGDAYRYLMDNYQDGDNIYLFGFSRGAFTVRALASLINVFGLLCHGNHGAIPYILDMYSKRTKSANRTQKIFRPDETFKWQFSHSHPVRIKFCGLWDTVSTYGWIYDPIKLPFLGMNPIIDVGRHAVSIHERRCFYQDNLWGPCESPQDFRQVWFTGVHSDIGGSYPENTSGLSKIALEWMMVEAIAQGLELNEFKAKTVLGKCTAYPAVADFPNYAAPDATVRPNDSLFGPWWICEFLPQQDPHEGGKRWVMPLGRGRRIPPNAHIHESVFESHWRPETLPPHVVEPWVRLNSTEQQSVTNDFIIEF